MGSDTKTKPAASSLKTDVQKALLAGGASMLAATSTHPIDLIKIRMQLQKPLEDGTKKYKNMPQGILLVAKEEGIRKGIYKGIEGAWLRESVYSTLRLGLYEPIKRTMHVKKDSSIVWKFLSGSMAGLVASAIANPLDLLKIRMQAQKGEPMSLGWHVRDVYAHGGILGFWKGVLPTCLRAMKMNGTKLAVYDSIKTRLTATGYFDEGIPGQFIASVGAGFF